MSRGVKDLRELICISRLTIRDSDEDIYFSDEDAIPNSLSSESDTQQNSISMHKCTRISPDSGISLQGKTVLKNDHIPHPPIESANKSKRKRKKKVNKTLASSAKLHELPKSKPLPPLSHGGGSSVQRSETSSSCSSTHENEILDSNKPKNKHSASASSSNSTGFDGNFDYLLTFLDAALVSEWLLISNAALNDMTSWIKSGDNFVQFSHFWLSEMPSMQCQGILKLEYSILKDQFNLAFISGRDTNKLSNKDIVYFLQAVFREYPAKLFSSKGAHIFLNYLDILTSERTVEYKKLLSDVKCSTKVKQHAYWTLACRGFCLVSMWNAVINFFQRLQADIHATKPPEVLSLTKSDGEMYHRYMLQAIQYSHLDVINYLIASGKVKYTDTDSHHRTVIFTAVAQNKLDVLDFFAYKVKGVTEIINIAADNGNTPLHAAANRGSVEMVEALLKIPGINVNCVNAECDEATPLHLAVMHGHKNVIKALLAAHADLDARMGSYTPVDLARDFGHENLLNLFEK